MSLRNNFLLPGSEIQIDSIPAKDYLSHDRMHTI